METSWVLFLIILCSRSSAVEIYTSNSSIIDDFYLLDKDMQLEICNLIKETNTSTQFTQQERMQVKRDFCDQLEALDNQEIEKNLLLVDDEKSSGSEISDQISAIGSTSFSEEGGGFTVSNLPRESISDQVSSGSLSPAIEENLQSTSSEVSSTSSISENSKSSETFRFLITSEDSNGPWQTSPSTSSSSSSSSPEASTSETVTLVTPEDTAITADSPDQSSTPGNFNRREIILNSNTPMIPDPTYPDEEPNLSNSLELIDIDGYSSESSSIANYGGKNGQLTNASKNDEASCSCNENKSKEGSSTNTMSKSIPYLKRKKCSKCSKKSSNATVNKIEDQNDLKTLEETKVLDESNELKTSTTGEPCLTCSSAGFFQITKNYTTSKVARYSYTSPEKEKMELENSSTEVSSENSSRSSQLIPFEKPTSRFACLNETTLRTTSVTKIFPGEYSVLPENTKDRYVQGSAKECNKTTNEFSGEYHTLPEKKKDSSEEDSSMEFSTPFTTRQSDPCSECRLSAVSSTTSEDPSYNSSCPKYCSSESSADFIDLASDTKTLPPSSDDFETSYDIPPSPTNSSDTVEINSNDSIPATNEFTTEQFYESSTSPLYETLPAVSTSYFCGSSAKSRHQFYNRTTSSSGSSPKPTCNPNKLTVNPKSPRKSRRLTKILSSLGKLHSYAGFFKVDQQMDTRLFFWFFCNQKWKHTPLIVWLQGEPGLSSLHGLFQEHGPYYLEQKEDGFDMKLRKLSWTTQYNVLYLDHCVGCGFSSSEHHQAYIPSYEQVAKNVYQALCQFFKIWHEMVPNDLYLAGSYGGAKYIPVIAQTIHNENKVSVCSQKMKLKGLMIGGPYVDSGVMVNYNDFFLANGIIDEVGHKDMIPIQYHAQELIRAGKYQDAIDFLNLHIYCLMSQAGYEVYKDVRYLKETPEENMQNVVQSAQFKRMVCIDDIDFEIKQDILVEEIMPSVDTVVSELLCHYKILFYNGQFDLMAPYMLTSKALLKLEWKSIDQFYTTEIINWCPNTDSNSCPEGYFRSYQNLTHVMIRNSGHFVGTSNSRSLYYLLKWFVEDKFQGYQDSENWYE